MRQEFKLADLLEFASIPRSTYYYQVNSLNKKDKYKDIKTEINKIYHEHKGRYGYRRITLELRNRNYHINHKVVQRLMKEMKLKSLIRVKKYKSYKGEVGTACKNLLNRNFNASKPNQKWVTDVTEFNIRGTKVYLSPIIDLFNGEIISYNISLHPSLKQVMDMLNKAFLKIPDNTNLIFHSDQGWQYRHKRYQFRLKKKGIKQSMSRKGNCLDNAVAENFFGLLKSELLYLQDFKSVDNFISELKDYIYYYNNYRIKGKLKGLSPVNYRIQSFDVA